MAIEDKIISINKLGRYDQNIKAYIAQELSKIETGTDTNDATATEDKVFLDETFYAGGKKKTGTFTIASEISSQDGLISAIKTALQGKASGGGGGGTGEDLTALLNEQEELISTLQNTLKRKASESNGEATPTQEKTVEIKENGTVGVLPDEGYVLSKVTANVAVPIPDGYIVPSGTLEVTENGTYDATEYASVSVTVESSGGGDANALLDALLNNTLTSIDSDVTSIVAYACRGLSKLKTVNLPNATSIGTYAFYYCTAMTSINAPKVTSLGTYAFYNCDALTSVNFPLATSIAQNSFYSCANLAKADFGVAGTINQAGFAYCENLEALILRKSDGICKLATATNALQGSAIANGTGYVYVPQALIEEYKTATNWVNYAAQFRAIEDYPEITGG